MKLLIIFAIYTALAYGRLPPGVNFPKCRRGPNLKKCLIRGIEQLRPLLKKGIPEIHVPRLEPFKMRHINLDAQIDGLKMKGEASNIVAHGASHFKIVDAKIDLKNYIFEVHALIPRLQVTADYDCHGSKLYVFPVSGSGEFKATLNDIYAIIKADGHMVKRNGVEYIKLDEITMNIKFGPGARVHVQPDAKSMAGQAAANFINASPDQILEMVRPVVNKAAAPLVKTYLNKILNVVSLNDVLTY